MEKVIICITTYNLEKYIAQALNSILSQKTSFRYKIIVADDCSSDGTIDILKKYKEKYPEIIEVMFSSENKGSLANSNRIFDGIQCEYFAFLDGDDYWVNEKHLQMQVDFLDNNKQYSMCAGNTRYLREGHLAELMSESELLGKSYSFHDYLNNRMPFFHTSSILVRNTIFINGIPKCFKDAVGKYNECALRGEDFRRILHLEQGPLYAFDEILSVYRIHSKGIWQGCSNTRRYIETAISQCFYSEYFEDKYGRLFENKRQEAYQNMIFFLLTEQGFSKDYKLTRGESELLSSFFIHMSEKNKTEDLQKMTSLQRKAKWKLFKLL